MIDLELLLAGFDLKAFISVIIIDLVLSGDNALIIAMAASNLHGPMRRKAIVYGIALAAIFRIIFSFATFWLLQIPGIALIGGLLLIWVSWRLWCDIRKSHGGDDGQHPAKEAPKNFRAAMVSILVADVTMSLDNVLAVAGAAHDSLIVLIFGLALSIVLMAVAANWIARILDRYHWISYLGLLV
ncbi:MAG: YjbE family putative metal transport protein, partial [Pseudomonadota bacterium]